MPNLFADTSGLGNLIDPTQPYHALAADLYRTSRQQNHRIATTNYILAELVALLTSPLRIPRSLIIEFVDSLTASPFVEIVHIDPTLHEQAWHFLKSRPTRTGASSIVPVVVMQQRDLTAALTTDHHFEQAGFARLLKPSQRATHIPSAVNRCVPSAPPAE